MYRVVSLHPRHAIVAVAIVLTIALPAGFTSIGNGDGVAPPTRLDRFPAEVVAAPLPRLPAYAENPWARVNQQVDSTTALWRQAFDAAGDSYAPPELARQVPGECSPTSAWAGVYCMGAETIVIDLDAHARRHAGLGNGRSDLVLGYIVAHEVGHHVQTLRGAPALDAPDTVLRRELHANCLAGVWGKVAGQPLPPTWFYGVDAAHGTAAQQIRWLNEGYRAGRPADCDAIWSTSTSP